MAKDNAVKFIELLSGDAELQAKLREASAAYEGPKEEKAVFEAVVVPLAEQAGLPLPSRRALPSPTLVVTCLTRSSRPWQVVLGTAMSSVAPMSRMHGHAKT